MALPIRQTGEGGEGARRHPLPELERLHRQLDSFFDEWPPLTSHIAGGFTPLADVEEEDDAYVVDIELPGVQRSDLEVEVSGRRLTVRGERKDKERVGILRRRERTVGRFRHEVALPGDIDDAAVEARLDQGVLTVRLPKAAGERRRRIAIG